MGFIVNCSGIKPDPSRVESILNFPEPKNVKQLQSFLGLCNFDRDFCENFATLSEPLTRLLRKKYPWIWSDEQVKRKL